MKFSKYRSESLKELWIKLEGFGYGRKWIINQSTFSTWSVDNIIADHWKDERPIAICAYELLQYVELYVI